MAVKRNNLFVKKTTKNFSNNFRHNRVNLTFINGRYLWNWRNWFWLNLSYRLKKDGNFKRFALSFNNYRHISWTNKLFLFKSLSIQTVQSQLQKFVEISPLSPSVGFFSSSSSLSWQKWFQKQLKNKQFIYFYTEFELREITN